MNSHDSEQQVRRFMEQRMSAQELAEFARRIRTEPELRNVATQWVNRYRDLEEARAPEISHEMLISYVEESLDQNDREFVEAFAAIDPEVESQLAELRANRAQLLELDQAVFEPPAKRQASFFGLGFWPSALFAAAVFLVAFIVLRSRSEPTFVVARIPDEVVALAASSGMGTTLSPDEEGLLRPVATAVDTAQPELTWKPVRLATEYRVTVLDAKGEVAYRDSTTKTTLVVGHPLPNGATYTWSVAALDRDGSSLEVLSADASRQGKFAILSAAKYAECLARLRKLPPQDHFARANTEVAYGLLDQAESDVRLELTTTTDPRRRVAATRLLNRILSRSNG